MIEKFKELGIIAVIRGKNHEEAKKYVKASIDGGICAIELTYTIPDMPKLLCELKKEYNQIFWGAGSILNSEMAINAIEAGAEYIISPGYSDAVNDVCKKKNIMYLPGCMTITEIMNAIDKGNKFVKIFPGNLFGPSYIKAIKAPIPNINIMPTGGVDVENIKTWFENGVTCVGVGSSLLESGNYDTIKKTAKEFVGKFDEYRKEIIYK